MIKKMIVFIVCLSMLMTMGPAFAGTVETEAGYEISQKMMPTYTLIESTCLDEPYYFIEGKKGIPYVEMEEYLTIYNALILGITTDAQMSLTSYADGDQYAWVRENGAAMMLDFEEDTITFNNYDAFISRSYALSFVDVLANQYYDSEGNPILFERQEDMSFDRPGEPKVFDLSLYGIDLICQDGKYYVPLQTIVDIIFAPHTNYTVLYNDEAVFYVGDGLIGSPGPDGQMTLTPLGEIYYSVPARERTEEEARFGYAELCLMLDHFYGLKDIHQITDFDTVFTQIGFKDALMSPDAGLADIALKAFISLYLDDLHTKFRMPSWMVPDDAEHEVLRTDRSMTKMLNNQKIFNEARLASNPDGVPHYQEIGNTAYITFDQFDSPVLAGGVELFYSLTDEQIEQAALGDPADTIALAVYAHRQINRDNSPIENVVLDLSNNIGGGYDIAVFITAWFLGIADVAFQEQNTGALSALAYRADVNLDRVFDEKDVLTDKNLYCLISPVSFSCGNLVPACLKSSQQVTMIGRQSGGGSGGVQYESTAWGTFFRISGHRNISILKNGSFYDTDQGVLPDYYLSKLSSFYDREKLTDIINNMD